MSAVLPGARKRRRAPMRVWTVLWVALSGVTVPGAGNVAAQEDTTGLPVMVARLDDAAMLSPFRLTKDDVAQLALPGGTPRWGIASEGPGATALDALVARLEPGLRDATVAILDGRYADSASVMAAIDTALGPAVALDSLSAMPVDMDAALRPVQRDTTPRLVRDRLRARLRTYPPLEGDQGPPLPEEALEKLPPLEGIWFPDGYMFRTALRLTLADVAGFASPRAIRRILAVSRKPEGPSPDSVFLQPLAWSGDECGCGVYAEGELWEPEFYGIYPYWEAPQTEEALAPKAAIDLSMFTRVGYYGVTFDSRGRIRDPLHWKTGKYPASAWPFQGRDFADFAVEAHAHKVNVDLVVYKDDWNWLPETLDATSDDVKAVFEELSREMLERISEPLGNFMDRMKPLVSLGQSPRRTLGDGITLDFDFSGIETPERQDELFEYLESIEFFKAFHRSLEARESDGSRVLHMDLDYRLNLIVPLNCVVADPDMEPEDGCAFYSVEHLNRLRADSVDLFLIDMTAVGTRPALAGASIEERTRLLRTSLDALGAKDQLELVTRVIPLVVTDPGDPMEDFIRISDMSFRGIGGWSAMSMGDVNESLKAIFLESPPAGSLAARIAPFEERLCDFMCPARWWVRFLIWVVGIAYVLFWVWTESDFDRKAFYGTRAHSALVVGFCLTLVATLWCDPYWKSRQTLIMSVLTAVGVVAFLLAQRRRRQEREYP